MINTFKTYIRLIPLIAYGIYAFPFPLHMIPGLGSLDYLISGYRLKTIYWITQNIMDGSYKWPTYTDSKDTFYHWLGLGLIIVCSILIGVVVKAFVKRDVLDRYLDQFFTLFFRYYLAFNMLYYGLIKFYRLQFTPLTLDYLTTSLGDSTPTNLMWYFFGYSHEYNIYMGILEVSAALLLLFRRTTLIGALMSFAIMSVIVPMNFTFNVAVKLGAMHVLVASLILVIRLGSQLPIVLTGGVGSLKLPLPLEIPRLKKPVLIAIKLVVVSSMFYYSINYLNNWKRNLPWLSSEDKLYGLYEVTYDHLSNSANFRKDDLRYVIVEFSQRICFKKWDGSKQYIPAEANEDGNLYFPKKDSFSEKIQVKDLGNNRFSMVGSIGGDSINLSANKIDVNKFRLMSRRSSLINEQTDHNIW